MRVFDDTLGMQYVEDPYVGDAVEMSEYERRDALRQQLGLV